MQRRLAILTFEPPSTVLARLSLHQSQRCQAIPTLSVLQGKIITARQLWTQWSNQTQRATGIGVYTSLGGLLEIWLTATARHHNLRSLILQHLAALTHRSEAELTAFLANSSDYQQQLFWEHLAPPSVDVDQLRTILTWLPDSPTVGPQTQQLVLADSSKVLATFAAVARLFLPSAVPGLLVLLPDEKSRSEAALIALTQLVAAVPQMPVALALTTAQGQDLLHRLPESKAKAMLRSGLIEVSSPAPDEIKQWLSNHGLGDEQLQPLLQLAQTHGTTPEALNTAVTLLSQAHQTETAAAAAVYRSQAEWFLFQYLEAKPTTAGRFQMNARLDIDFGNRPMEVDFLDAAAKIVIELDGYYHFQSPENYRRDRRKDRLLQQHGFLVLRFLAEDVVSYLGDILETIDQALTTRLASVSKPSEA